MGAFEDVQKQQEKHYWEVEAAKLEASKVSAEVLKRQEKKKLRRRLGRPTVLTSPLGLTGEPPVRKPTLLGGY